LLISDLLGTASRRGIALAKPEARSAKTAEVLISDLMLISDLWLHARGLHKTRGFCYNQFQNVPKADH